MLVGTAQNLKKSNPLEIFISGQKIQQTYLLVRTRRFGDQPTAFSLYNALVLPHIDCYCCMVWGAKPTLVSKILKLQNRALRIVLKLPPLSPTNLLFSHLNKMTVAQRIHFQLACQAFKASISVTPDCLCQRLNPIQPGDRPIIPAITHGNLIILKYITA